MADLRSVVSSVALPAVRVCAPTACAECPWRLGNLGKKPDPGKFYTRANLRRLWSGLRDGASMSCHPTDDRMNEWDHMNVPAHVHVRECAGALTLVQREFHRVQELLLAEMPNALAVYRRTHPRGLTRDGITTLIGRVVVFPGDTPMGRPNLNDLAIGYDPLGTWQQVET